MVNLHAGGARSRTEGEYRAPGVTGICLSSSCHARAARTQPVHVGLAASGVPAARHAVTRSHTVSRRASVIATAAAAAALTHLQDRREALRALLCPLRRPVPHKVLQHVADLVTVARGGFRCGRRRRTLPTAPPRVGPNLS